MKTNLATKTVDSATAQAVARSFIRGLASAIGSKNLRTVAARNAVGSPNVCASHDFCDANVYMSAAFTRVVGHEIDLQSDADGALWDAAWDCAKRAGFRAGNVV